MRIFYVLRHLNKHTAKLAAPRLLRHGSQGLLQVVTSRRFWLPQAAEQHSPALAPCKVIMSTPLRITGLENGAFEVSSAEPKGLQRCSSSAERRRLMTWVYVGQFNGEKEKIVGAVRRAQAALHRVGNTTMQKSSFMSVQPKTHVQAFDASLASYEAALSCLRLLHAAEWLFAVYIVRRIGLAMARTSCSWISSRSDTFIRVSMQTV
jgi:hypothetical protein